MLVSLLELELELVSVFVTVIVVVSVPKPVSVRKSVSVTVTAKGIITISVPGYNDRRNNDSPEYPSCTRAKSSGVCYHV